MIPSDYVAIEQRARVKRGTAAREEGEAEVEALQETVAAQSTRIASLEADVATLMLAAGFTTQARPIVVVSPPKPFVLQPPSRIPGFRKALQPQIHMISQGTRSYRP